MKSGKPSGIRVVANKTDEGGCQAKLDLCFKFSSTNTHNSKYYYTVVKLAERTDVQVFNLWMEHAAKVSISYRHNAHHNACELYVSMTKEENGAFENPNQPKLSSRRILIVRLLQGKGGKGRERSEQVTVGNNSGEEDD